MVLERYACPKKFVADPAASRQNDRTSSLQQRPVSCLHHHKWNETGLILAPVLFNLFFMCMLAHAVQDMEEGVYVVVQFYLWFKFYFPLFWSMVMYDKEFETK